MGKILKLNNEIDVLPYYKKVAEKLSFLKNRELATKVWIPDNIKLLKRGSKLKPIFIQDLLLNIDSNFLKLRKFHLDQVRNKLTKKQELIWQYFPPRKLSELVYATNHEKPGKPIKIIYFDIDRTNVSAEIAQRVALELLNLIKTDQKFNTLVKYKIMPMWTGKSFHIYLILKKEMPPEFYTKYIQYSKESPLDSFTGVWAKKISEKLKLKVLGGHEKKKNQITIDPSQTPSGKLARAPFSLHLKDAKTIDGIALPLNQEDLTKKNLTKILFSYNADKLIKDLDKFSRNIPH